MRCAALGGPMTPDTHGVCGGCADAWAARRIWTFVEIRRVSDAENGGFSREIGVFFCG